MADDKQKALEVALLQIEKQFGKGSVMKLGEAADKLNIETIPTGALSLDLALGVGGIPRGRIVEILNSDNGQTGWRPISRLERATIHQRTYVANFCARPVRR